MFLLDELFCFMSCSSTSSFFVGLFFSFLYLGQQALLISWQDSTQSSETCTAKQHNAKYVPDSYSKFIWLLANRLSESGIRDSNIYYSPVDVMLPSELSQGNVLISQSEEKEKKNVLQHSSCEFQSCSNTHILLIQVNVQSYRWTNEHLQCVKLASWFD